MAPALCVRVCKALEAAAPACVCVCPWRPLLLITLSGPGVGYHGNRGRVNAVRAPKWYYSIFFLFFTVSQAVRKPAYAHMLIEITIFQNVWSCFHIGGIIEVVKLR